MTGLMRQWVLKLIGTALVSACALALTPEGRAKRAVRLACGAAAVIALISPASQFDFTQYASYLAEGRGRAEEITRRAENEARTETRFRIEEKTAAYISDKAEELGITGLEVSVTAEWNDAGFWYPARCSIAGEAPGEAKNALSRAIEAELGISAAEQTWSAEDET